MHKVERVFHPIGQGAFYSEHHLVDVAGAEKVFNIVYDCGNSNYRAKLPDREVRQAFSKNNDVDILFISHFDFDHISRIPVLKDQVRSIKKVIMPFLDQNEIDLLSSIYQKLGFGKGMIDLVRNPESFFDDATKVIRINPTENHNEPENNDNSVNIDEFDGKALKSGDRLTLSGLPNWFFIPFNYKYSKRHQDLLDNLNSEGFDIATLLAVNDKTLAKIIDQVERKKLKNIYDKLEGGINQNSMILYSGPKHSQIKYDLLVSGFGCRSYGYLPWFYREMYDRPACIYTGDADLNQTKPKQVFSSLWNCVGTIQIPHHGDLKSFEPSVLDDKYYFCPISYGSKNSYGHPSSRLLAHIVGNKSFPVLVTEDLSSGFIQAIEGE